MSGSTLRPGNLPAELTSFVGRRRELTDVRGLLGESRLVTLTGIGGVGKTRLALKVGNDVRRGFRGGVWLVDLAPLRDPGLVAQAVAAATGLRDDSTGWSLTSLTQYLAGQQLLLLMDNCEHLLDPSAVLVETLLRGAPELRIIATSRQPLGVAGEHTFTVPPLAVPDPEQAAPAPQALAQYEGIALFVERARAVAPHFAVTHDNAGAVTRLAQRLDGVPLALELAAARLPALTPQQILTRLDDRYRLLTSGKRTALPRQQSLQALIDWSFDLCSSAERALWARLSIFPRDFDLDAAEEVCSGDGLAREDVMEALTGLVDKSIPITDGRGPKVRYRLSETLREYGRNRLAESELEGVLRRRHRDYYQRLAERSSAEWFGPRQVEWTAWIQVEYVNLRAALEFCLAEPGEAAAGLAMFQSMGMHWVISGSLGEGRRFLDRALSVSTEPSVGRAKALWIAAWVAVYAGDLVAAEAAGREGRWLAERFGDAQAFGHNSVFLGMARMFAGDTAAAETLFREALESAGSQRPQVAAAALSRLAEVAASKDEVTAATAYYRDCVAICEAHEESWIRAYALWSWALLAWQQGDTAKATELATASLRLRWAFHDRVGIAHCLEVLAWIAAADAAHDRAARLLGAAETVRQSVGASLFRHQAGFHEGCEAQVARSLGERAFAKATRLGAQTSLADSVAYALSERADVAAAQAAEVALTRREREIADLVAQGLSNREIAAKLVISQRTGEGHVEHILAKLGFTSRAQIAAWVAEQRAASPG